MKIASGSRDVRYCRKERGLPRKCATANRVGDAHQLLIDDASRPNVLMSYFRVAHDRTIRSNWQPDVFTAGCDERARKLARQSRIDWRGRTNDGVGRITFAMRTLAPTIANDENTRRVAQLR